MKVISFIRTCPDETLAEFLATYVSSCVYGALKAAGIVDISDQKIQHGAEMVMPKVREFLHSDFESLGSCLNDAGNGTGDPSPTGGGRMKALVFSACLSVVSMVIVVTGAARGDIERYSVGLTLALLAFFIHRIWEE